jgi:hypothetical protein
MRHKKIAPARGDGIPEQTNIISLQETFALFMGFPAFIVARNERPRQTMSQIDA